MKSLKKQDDRKIIICTTFREFNGNSNDKIQRLFLESIKEQTYKNFILSVTTFGEKNVEKVLVQEEIPHIIFKGDAGEYRFSLTQVLQNAISLIINSDSHIILWTTCDVIFEKDFFENIINEFKPGYCGTSLPHSVYTNHDNYINNNNPWKLWWGLDLIFFDSDILASVKVNNIIDNYPNNGWGYFEFFLSGVGKKFFKKMINVRPYTVSKIENDRLANNETKAFFSLSTSHNKNTYESFMTDYHLNKDPYSILLNYKVLNKNFIQKTIIYFNLKRRQLAAKLNRFTHHLYIKYFKNRF